MRGSFKLFLLIMCSIGCANPISPPGGARDKEPPQIVSEQPVSGSSNHKGDNIVLEFNEYINFQGSTEKVLITPAMDPQPKFTLKGKKLTVGLPENLDENLSYSINLINAITDYTEGNALEIYKYVFSKGPIIDSASLSGSVKNAFDKKSISGVYVGLFPEGDTGAFVTTKAIYVAPTDKEGNFNIDYVKPGSYLVAALEDKNYDLKLDFKNERVSLRTDPLNVGTASFLEHDLLLFSTQQKPQILEYKTLTNSSLCLVFNQKVEELSLQVTPQDEQARWFLSESGDTLFYHWSASETKELNFKLTMDRATEDSINILLPSKLKSPPIKTHLSEKDLKEIRVDMGSFIKHVDESLFSVVDSVGKALDFTVRTKRQNIYIKIFQEYYAKLNLGIDSGAVRFITDQFNTETYTSTVTMVEATTKSTLSLDLGKVMASSTILELYNGVGNAIKVKDVSGLQKVNIYGLDESNYTVRIYRDSNKNGHWNTGNVDTQTAPEKTLLYRSDIKIKENWDKELQLIF
tara:strand:- start:1869 stop:3425 length:1557 start_codon:yes stop_codon:yes gene_type:complete